MNNQFRSTSESNNLLTSTTYKLGSKDFDHQTEALLNTSSSQQIPNISLNYNEKLYNEKFSSQNSTNNLRAWPEGQISPRVEEDDMLDLLSSPVDNKTILQFYKNKYKFFLLLLIF